MQHKPLLTLLLASLAACGGDSSTTGPSNPDVVEDTDLGTIDVTDDTSAAPDTVDDDAGALGESCETGSECLSGYCLDLVAGDGGELCSQRCTESDCPVGFDCVTLSDTGTDAIRVCLPDDLCIDVDADGYGFGSGCTGLDCDDTNGDINPAMEEICDGIDQDCDLEVDENTVDSRQACATGFPGICEEGRTVCNGGTLACESVEAPSEELCNAIDDDCDGEVDEEACACPSGTRDCDDTCIAEEACCTDADCDDDMFCPAVAGTCACRPFGATCPSDDATCVDPVPHRFAIEAHGSNYQNHVAIDGDTIVVGNLSESSLHLYARQADNTWALTQTILASEVTPPGLGQGVELRGDVLTTRTASTGDVYVFVRTDGTWAYRATLAVGARQTNQNRRLEDAIGEGFIVSVDRPTGAAYVFRQQGDGDWLEEAALTGGLTDDWARMSVATDEGTIMVGSLTAVHVYDHIDGSWQETQTLPGTGEWIHLSDGTAVIDGRLYHRGADGLWTSAGELFPCELGDPRTPQALDGRWYVVGEASAEEDIGQAWLYRRDGDVWLADHVLLPTEAVATLNFGVDVDVSGDTVVIATNVDATREVPRFYTIDF